MKFHVLSLFPEMLESVFHTSITGRAAQNGSISLHAVNIRDYTENKHKKVDDYPYGGGAGMLMQAQPVFDACQALLREIADERGEEAPRVIYVTPQGVPFCQELAQEFAQEEDLIFLCGHYEGIDERVLEEIVTDYVSIGDYVLTGGELPALVMIDAIARLTPGVLHNEQSAQTESFHNDLLEYPQYSRPETWRGRQVPPVLLSGDHRKISDWRLEQSIRRTKERRPDLYASYERTMRVAARLEASDKLLYMDMIAPLRAGTARLICEDEKGVLLREKQSGDYMLAAADIKTGARLLQRWQQESAGEEQGLLVLHQEAVKELACAQVSFARCSECLQAVYTRGVALPVSGTVTIRPLTLSDAAFVSAHYHLVGGEDYVEERIVAHAVYGAFVEDKPVGFIGIHREGCMGMLHVLEAYRRQGVGEALLADCVNRQLKAGAVPYCQIFEENTASVKLHQKLGFRISGKKMWWLEKQLA